MIPKLKYEYLLGLISLFSIFLINSLLSLYSQNDLCLDCENYFESAIYLFKNFEVHYYRPIGMSIIYGLPILFGYDNYLDLYKFDGHEFPTTHIYCFINIQIYFNLPI